MFSLHLFESNADYNTARSTNYSEPWVSATNISENGNSGETPLYRVDYNKTEREKVLETPLTFEITSAGNIVWKANNTAYTVTLEYSKDNGQNWTQITSNTGSSAPSISVSAGDTVQFRCGTDDGYATMSSDYSSGYNTFSGTTAGFKIKGNIMSLLSKNNFASLDILQSAYTFCRLFRYCTGLTDASKLILPADNLTLQCYRAMFANCSNLAGVPKLPAMNLGEGCYNGMFQYCYKLTDSTMLPELPATTLANDCYNYMFAFDTGLTDASELVLPATTLVPGCYTQMFKNCTSLTSAPELPATTLANNCYEMMFESCTRLTTAPELPATILLERCYYQMFYQCTSLNYIKCLATDISASNSLNNWVNGVASSGTFVKNPNMSSWATGTSGIPNGWTVQDA